MFRFEISEQMTMVIINALGNHAYREAAPVISELQRQANAQQQRVPMPPGNGKDDAAEVTDNALRS